MNPLLDGALQEEIDALQARGLERRVAPSVASGTAFDFTSNDYLELSRHPAVLSAAAQALQEFGAGARSSRLLGGGCVWEQRAEESLADWLGAEAALLFPTGYQANLGLITTLARAGDALLCDSLIHASMIDACRLSKAKKHVYDHNDLSQLEGHLVAAAGARRRLVLVESIYSMDGDSAPLSELNELCIKHDAWLVVDEAHAIGVCGEHGEGLAFPTREHPLERLAARVVTGGKALGCAGGFVVGSKPLRTLLIHAARSFIFTTGIAPAIAAALHAAIGVARQADQERAQLRASVSALAQALQRDIPRGPILPFVVGGNDSAMELAQRLQADGFDVRAVRPPTVPAGSARLRIVLHSGNTQEAVGNLAAKLIDHPVPPASVKSASLPRAFAIVGTDTDIGKTVASAVVARALAQNAPVTYWKPVQTGDDSDTETVRTLTEGTGVSFDCPVYAFPLPASPHEAAAAAQESICFDSLLAAYSNRVHAARDGALLIELAGGLLVPYDDQHTQADWLAITRPRILLVARSGLGTLNHTLLTLEALRSRGLEPEALILVGASHPSNRETLKRRSGLANVIELPLFEPLSPHALQSWLDEHPLDFKGATKP